MANYIYRDRSSISRNFNPWFEDIYYQYTLCCHLNNSPHRYPIQQSTQNFIFHQNPNHNQMDAHASQAVNHKNVFSESYPNIYQMQPFKEFHSAIHQSINRSISKYIVTSSKPQSLLKYIHCGSTYGYPSRGFRDRNFTCRKSNRKWIWVLYITSPSSILRAQLNIYTESNVHHCGFNHISFCVYIDVYGFTISP